MFRSIAFLAALVASVPALATGHDLNRRELALSIVQHIKSTVPAGWNATTGPVITPAFVQDPVAFAAACAPDGCPGVRVGEMATWNGARGGAFSVMFDGLTVDQCRRLLTHGPDSLGALGASDGDDFTTHILDTPAKVRTFCAREPQTVALIYPWAPPLLTVTPTP